MTTTDPLRLEAKKIAFKYLPEGTYGADNLAKDIYTLIADKEKKAFKAGESHGYSIALLEQKPKNLKKGKKE